MTKDFVDHATDILVSSKQAFLVIRIGDRVQDDQFDACTRIGTRNGRDARRLLQIINDRVVSDLRKRAGIEDDNEP